jgi:hypothetical protein
MMERYLFSSSYSITAIWLTKMVITVGDGYDYVDWPGVVGTVSD